MSRWVLGALCSVLGFGAGLLTAPLLLDGPNGHGETEMVHIDPPSASHGPTAMGKADRTAPDERAARLALAAASLERASQSPKLIAPARSSTPPGGDIVTNREESVTVDQLPAALQAALLQVAQGRPIQELTLERRTRNGRPLYETEFELEGVEHELKLDEEGKILESEVDFAISELPSQVTAGITAAMPGAILLDAEREQIRDDPAFFEVTIRHQGQSYEVQVAEDGRVLRTSPR